MPRTNHSESNGEFCLLAAGDVLPKAPNESRSLLVAHRALLTRTNWVPKRRDFRCAYVPPLCSLFPPITAIIIVIII